MLASTAPVITAAEAVDLVRIDPAAVQAFAEQHTPFTAPRLSEDRLHATFLPPKRFCNYLLLLEALNFSFWDAEPRWRVDYQGAKHDGYWALVAALHRALREQALPLWDAHWMAQVDEAQMSALLAGSGHPPPLLTERASHVREVGEVLLTRWQGQFAELVASCEGVAPRLAQAIVDEFPSFRDEAVWRGQPVRFYKRAQIAVADLSRLLPNDPLGQFEGLEQLTAFADYKVPQVLRREGLIVLSPPLAGRLERLEELPPGSEDEVAIRAATLWACHLVAHAVHARQPAGASPVTAMDLDYLLWSAGQDKTGLLPYHRTRTGYY